MASTHEEIPLLPTSHNRDTNTPHNEEQQPTPSSPPSKPGGYSLFVAICFSLNYSIGSGILGLPYEYYNAGFVLGSILLIYLGILTYITYTFVADGIQRAEAITTLCEPFSITKHKLLSDPEYIKQTLKGISSTTVQSEYKLIRNEYQLSQLIGIFGGKWWKLFYDISYGISTLIALWSYSALFGVSLARNIGIAGISDACDMELSGATSDCRGLYSLYVVIFYIWTIIMSLMDFTEQKGVQIFATIARVVIIFLMVFTSIGLIYSDWYYSDDEYLSSVSTSGTYAEGVLSWKWSGMAYMIAISAFAYGNQYCVTDIIQPLSLHDRTNNQHKLWLYSVGICIVVYVTCGISISIYFGSETQSPCTLSWAGFMGFSIVSEQPVWASIVSWMIVLFPAIDIGSAYPLNAVTLANTLEAAIISDHNSNKEHLNITEEEEEEHKEELDDDNDEATALMGGGGGTNNNNDDVDHNNNSTINRLCSNNNKYNTLFRILICTATAIFALIEWNFDLILAISGAFGLLAVYGGPVILEWKSREMIKYITGNNVNSWKTPLTKNWTSHKSWLIVIAGTSVIAFVAVFVDLVQQYV